MHKKKRPATTNTTLLRLKNTPFKNATEMKVNEERICREEWENIERAKHRRLLFRKIENEDIISIFKNGLRARFIGEGELAANFVKIFLTPDECVQVELDEDLRNPDSNLDLQGLVKVLTETFMNGYLTALGIQEDRIFQSAKAEHPNIGK